MGLYPGGLKTGRGGGGFKEEFYGIITIFKKCVYLILEALRRGGGQIDPPSIFFGFKFLLLDRLSKALAQLFLVCEHIF